MKQYNLGIGQVVFTRRQIRIRTILGSCVSLTLFDPVSNWGGMCHALYLGKEECCLYLDDAAELMVKKFRNNGIPLERVEAKLFGAAMPLSDVEIISPEIQDKLDAFIDKLRSIGVTIITQDIGGSRSREVLFDTTDGSVYVRYIKTEFTFKRRSPNER